jgi:hypothetical protein
MLASETEMFPVKKYDTHIERIQAAIGVNGPVADFFGQLQAVYSTMAVLEITELLSERQFIKFSEEEIDAAFHGYVPYAKLAYVIRIQDFHRGGLVKPEHSGKMHMYGTVQVTKRQKHGTGYVGISLPTGEMTKVRTHNSTVKLDKPLLQSKWSFKTDDMPSFVDIRQVNTDNYNGVVQFLWQIGYPKSLAKRFNRTFSMEV